MVWCKKQRHRCFCTDQCSTRQQANNSILKNKVNVVRLKVRGVAALTDSVDTGVCNPRLSVRPDLCQFNEMDSLTVWTVINRQVKINHLYSQRAVHCQSDKDAFTVLYFPCLKLTVLSKFTRPPVIKNKKHKYFRNLSKSLKKKLQNSLFHF